MSDVPVHRGMFPGRTFGYKGRSAQELWQNMGEDGDGETSGHGGVRCAGPLQVNAGIVVSVGASRVPPATSTLL